MAVEPNTDYQHDFQDYSPAYQKAIELLRLDPLPEDAGDQLEELQKRIRPEERKWYGGIWEAFAAASDIPLPE